MNSFLLPLMGFFLAILFVTDPHTILFVILAGVVGAIVGYLFRNAIAKDISSLQLNAWITKLEAVGEKDLASMKAIAAGVATDLRKLL